VTWDPSGLNNLSFTPLTAVFSVLIALHAAPGQPPADYRREGQGYLLGSWRAHAAGGSLDSRQEPGRNRRERVIARQVGELFVIPRSRLSP